MTISLKHDIAWKEMKEIKNVMKMKKFYFVVPHTKYREFKKQNFVVTRKTRSQNRLL
jgi:hypothetical protein